VWETALGAVLLLSGLVAVARRWPFAKLWWVLAGSAGMLLTFTGRRWEFQVLLWSLPLFAEHFRTRPLGGTLRAERFATRAELRPYVARLATTESRGAILTGTIWRKRFWRWTGMWVALQPTFARPEVGHGLVVAPTGLGKGLAIVTQLLQNFDHSALVLDLKGEAFRLTSGARARMGHQIIRLDLGNDQGHRWDPTAHAQDEDDLRVMAQALTHDPRDRDPFWAQAAEEMLTTAMLAARCCGQPLFPFLRALFDHGIAGAAELIREINPLLGRRFLPGGRLEGRVTLGIWLTLAARLRPLLTDRVLAMLTGNDFSVADLRTRRTTVYITVPEAQLERLAPILAVVWTSLMVEIIKHADGNMARPLRPLLLMLDEAGRIAIPHLPGYLATLRSRGVTCLVYVQSVSQLRHLYGRDHAHSISNNCALQIYYQQHDEATAQMVSRRLGEVGEFASGIAATGGGMGSSGARVTRTSREYLRPLLSAQEVMRLPEHTTLVFYRDVPPMWIGRLDWRSHRTLCGLASVPSVVLPPLPPWTVRGQNSTYSLHRPSNDGYVDPDT